MHDYLPTMPIEGNYYKFTRLGHEEVVELLEMAAILMTEGFERLQMRVSFVREISKGIALNEKGELDPEQAKSYMGMLTMAFGVRDFYNKFISMCSRILYKTDEEGKLRGDYVSLADFKDRDLFPAFTLPQLCLYLIVHPDFELLKGAVVAGASIPFFRQALEDVSDLANEGLSEAMKKLNENQTPPENDATPS